MFLQFFLTSLSHQINIYSFFFINAGFFPKDFVILKISRTNGVLPVPPKYILPTHITGMGNFFLLLKLDENFLNSKIIKYMIDKGKSIIAQKDIFELSQNFGFLKFILQY